MIEPNAKIGGKRIMRIVELPADRSLLFKFLRRYQHRQDRLRERATPGVHVTTILDDIAKSLWPEKYKGEWTEPEKSAFFSLGNVFEGIMAEGLQQASPGWNKPDPRQDAKGIWCSPDGWQKDWRTIDEIKMTWVGMKDFTSSAKFKRYVWQGAKYCYEWDSQRLRIHVLFVRGKFGVLPAIRTFVVRFTSDDLEEINSMIWQHGHDMGLLQESA